MLTDELFYGTKTYYQQFAKLCEPIKQYLKVTNSTYLNIDKDGGMVNINSDCEWMNGYIEGEYYKPDLHMVHPNNIQTGFCILTVYDNYQYQEYNDAMLYDQDKEYNHGFTYISKKNNNNFSAFCFITKSNKIINDLLNQAKIIEHFIKKLDQQIKLAFPKLSKNKVDLVKLKGDLFFKQQGIVFRE